MKASEKRVEEAIYQQWLSIYPNMITPQQRREKDRIVYVPPLKFMNFTEYLSQYIKPKISQRSREEILTDVEEIRRKFDKHRKAGK